MVEAWTPGRRAPGRGPLHAEARLAYSIRIDRDIEAVVVQATGPGSLEEGLQALAEALHTARAADLKAVLLDILTLEFVPTNAEASVIAGRLAELGDAGLRIAIVAPPGTAYGVARMVSVLTELLGARVVVFEMETEAVRWLQLSG